MAGSSSPCPDDNDCLRLPATSAPCIRGAEKKESTGLRLSQPCPPYVTPSSISSFGRRLNGVHTAGNKSMKNSGANTFCQSSASRETHQSREHCFVIGEQPLARWEASLWPAESRRLFEPLAMCKSWIGFEPTSLADERPLCANTGRPHNDANDPNPTLSLGQSGLTV